LEIDVEAVLVEINPRDLPKAGPGKAKAETGVAASITTVDNSTMVTRDCRWIFPCRVAQFIISFGCSLETLVYGLKEFLWLSLDQIRI
jgi:hypothetical protein